MGTVLTLAIIALAVWLWADGMRARESALQRCAHACKDAGVQFLDQTVALSSLRLVRNVRGQLVLRRRYRFEFSTDGHDRHRGEAAMIGHAVEFVRLEHPDGPFIMTGGTLHAIH